MTTLTTVGHPLSDDRKRDLVGIGIGPFNLSLAAALSHVPDTDAAFFDSKPEFAWHSGVMFPGSILQTSFLKDLVTPIMPTSPHSFLSYLVDKKRFYDFMAGRFEGVSRLEFNDYMNWVAHRLPSTNWGYETREVTHDHTAFQVRFANGKSVRALNLSIGTGTARHTPDWAEPHLGADCFHAIDYLHRKSDFSGRRVVVIGGGQTGAEIVLDLLSTGKAAHVSWVSNLARFSPLEEGGFVDQVFTPNYLQTYRSLPRDGQRTEVAGQKLASDGLTPVTVDAIYAEVYRRKHLEGGDNSVALLPGRNVFAMEETLRGFTLAGEAMASGLTERFDADVVILATGARATLPQFMDPLRSQISFDDCGRPELDANYQIQWQGAATSKIFGLNMGLSSHGIIDPQMSMMAWRSGVIANALAGREVFNVSTGVDLIDWPMGDDGQRAAVQALHASERSSERSAGQAVR